MNKDKNYGKQVQHKYNVAVEAILDAVNSYYAYNETKTHNAKMAENILTQKWRRNILNNKVNEPDDVDTLRRDANNIKDAVIRGQCHAEIDKMSKKILNMRKELDINENSFVNGSSANAKINSCKKIIARDYENIHKRLMIENYNQKVQNAANEKYANNALSGAQHNLNAVENMVNKRQQEELENFESRYSY